MTTRRTSLRHKLIIATLSSMFVGLSLIGYLGFHYTQKAYTEKILEQETEEINSMVFSIKEKISIMKQDANFIANFYAMQKLLNWYSIGVDKEVMRWKQATEDTFKSLIDLKRFYYKLRILDLEGIEKINVSYDHVKKQAIIQDQNKLQDLSNESYFKDALNLDQGEVHVSQMELNEEFGKVTYPHVPIVHFSALIYDSNGDKRGEAVINAYAEYLMEPIKKHSHTKESASSVLINSQGFYLYHQNEEKRWGWQLPHHASFKNEYPTLFKQVMTSESGVLEEGEKLFNFKRIYPNDKNKNEFWIVINEVDEAVVFAPLDEFKYLFLIVFTITVIVLALTVRYFISRVIDPLNDVTKQLGALSKGELITHQYNYRANDEIADLIASSEQLRENIENTISQARIVAKGDFSNRIVVASHNDALGHAINDMTEQLNSAALLAQQLSKGDLQGEVSASSEDDMLGNALVALVYYLKEITTVAESISVGNYNVNFHAAGEQDRLGKAISEMITTLKEVVDQADRIATGDYTQKSEPKSEEDRLGFALEKMTHILDQNRTKNNQQNWLKDGLNSLSTLLSGNKELFTITSETIAAITKHVGGASGVLFLYSEEKKELFLKASYAFTDREMLSNRFKQGEGVIGQCALERSPILLKSVKQEHYRIESGIISQKPLNTYTFPIVYEEVLIGVAEVASFEPFDALHKEYMNESARVASAFLYNTKQNQKIKELLEESQQSFEELQVKSEELQQNNVQMEEQRQQLEQQAAELKAQNEKVEKARNELDIQARELSRASKYKSEFLANMSHELRTPLNSIILLSKLLKENKQGMLNEDEVKKAKVIHRSGNDLLLLINDILDLSKVESGHMDITLSTLQSDEIHHSLQNLFEELAKEKSITFRINDTLQGKITTDEQKLMQILKNLLSNAFKFTQEGEVSLHIAPSDKESYAYKFAVHDSGIGIGKEKQALIFNAFKQVDGSISRQYGGTGLGLSISKKFAELLGGTIELQSSEGEGSTFTLYLPQQGTRGDDDGMQEVEEEQVPISEKSTHFKVPDQSVTDFDVDLSDKNILIVDDDPRNIFTISSSLQECGAQTCHALNGKEAIEKLRESHDDIDLVLMDIMMPVLDGYETMKQIRKDEILASMPIIAVTAKAMKEERQKCLDAGADDYLAKPIEHRMLIQLVSSWIEKGKHA